MTGEAIGAVADRRKPFAEARPAALGPARAAARGASRLEPAAIAVAAAALYSVLAWYLTLRLHIQYGDAVARIADGAYVVSSSDPHLAAVGFIWPPLPSLLALPLVLAARWWPALTYYGFAANVESILFGALSAFYFNRVLQALELGPVWRIPLSIVFLANPMIALYASNGMSEMMLIAPVLAALEGILWFLRNGSVGSLTMAGAALGISFFIRYESVPLAVALGLGLAIALWLSGAPRAKIEGALIFLLSPLAYSGFLWLYADWIIMGNPLYFGTTKYGNAGQIATGMYNGPNGPAAAAHHVLRTLVYVGRYYELFAPVVLGLGATVALFLLARRRDARIPMLVLFTLAVPVLQALGTYMHQTAGWDRFYIYLIPSGLVLLAFLAVRAQGRWRSIAGAAALSAAVIGSAGTFVALQSPRLSNLDAVPVAYALKDRVADSFPGTTAVAAYINAHPKMHLLMETFAASSVYLRIRDTRRVVTNSDRQFLSDLEAPLGKVGYFVLPQANPEWGTMSTIAKIYPRLWYGHPVKWAKLVKVFPESGFRIYRIVAEPAGQFSRAHTRA